MRRNFVHFEYCNNCQSHAWNTHHNEAKYHEIYLRLRNAIEEQFKENDFQILANQKPPHLIPVKVQENKYVNSRTQKYVFFPNIGSFEVTFNGKLIFSKKKTNSWPTVETILQQLSGELNQVYAPAVTVKKHPQPRARVPFSCQPKNTQNFYSPVEVTVQQGSRQSEESQATGKMGNEPNVKSRAFKTLYTQKRKVNLDEQTPQSISQWQNASKCFEADQSVTKQSAFTLTDHFKHYHKNSHFGSDTTIKQRPSDEIKRKYGYELADKSDIQMNVNDIGQLKRVLEDGQIGQQSETDEAVEKKREILINLSSIEEEDLNHQIKGLAAERQRKSKNESSEKSLSVKRLQEWGKDLKKIEKQMKHIETKVKEGNNEQMDDIEQSRQSQFSSNLEESERERSEKRLSHQRANDIQETKREHEETQRQLENSERQRQSVCKEYGRYSSNPNPLSPKRLLQNSRSVGKSRVDLGQFIGQENVNATDRYDQRYISPTYWEETYAQNRKCKKFEEIDEYIHCNNEEKNKKLKKIYGDWKQAKPQYPSRVYGQYKSVYQPQLNRHKMGQIENYSSDSEDTKNENLSDNLKGCEQGFQIGSVVEGCSVGVKKPQTQDKKLNPKKAINYEISHNHKKFMIKKYIKNQEGEHSAQQCVKKSLTKVNHTKSFKADKGIQKTQSNYEPKKSLFESEKVRRYEKKRMEPLKEARELKNSNPKNALYFGEKQLQRSRNLIEKIKQSKSKKPQSQLQHKERNISKKSASRSFQVRNVVETLNYNEKLPQNQKGLKSNKFKLSSKIVQEEYQTNSCSHHVFEKKTEGSVELALANRSSKGIEVTEGEQKNSSEFESIERTKGQKSVNESMRRASESRLKCSAQIGITIDNTSGKERTIVRSKRNDSMFVEESMNHSRNASALSTTQIGNREDESPVNACGSSILTKGVNSINREGSSHKAKTERSSSGLLKSLISGSSRKISRMDFRASKVKRIRENNNLKQSKLSHFCPFRSQVESQQSGKSPHHSQHVSHTSQKKVSRSNSFRTPRTVQNKEAGRSFKGHDVENVQQENRADSGKGKGQSDGPYAKNIWGHKSAVCQTQRDQLKRSSGGSMGSKNRSESRLHGEEIRNVKNWRSVSKEESKSLIRSYSRGNMSALTKKASASKSVKMSNSFSGSKRATNALGSQKRSKAVRNNLVEHEGNAHSDRVSGSSSDDGRSVGTRSRQQQAPRKKQICSGSQSQDINGRAERSLSVPKKVHSPRNANLEANQSFISKADSAQSEEKAVKNIFECSSQESVHRINPSIPQRKYAHILSQLYAMDDQLDLEMEKYDRLYRDGSVYRLKQAPVSCAIEEQCYLSPQTLSALKAENQNNFTINYEPISKVFNSCTIFAQKIVSGERLQDGNPSFSNQNLLKVMRVLIDCSEMLVVRLFEDYESIEGQQGASKEDGDMQWQRANFGVWLCVDHRWRCTVVNDVIPTVEDQCNQRSIPLYIHAAPDRSQCTEIWPVILEKAIVRAVGGYQKYVAMSLGELFQTLTGSNFVSYSISEDRAKNKHLLRAVAEASKKNFISVCEKHPNRLNELCAGNDPKSKPFYLLSTKSLEEETVYKIKDAEHAEPYYVKEGNFTKWFKKCDILHLRHHHNYCALPLSGSSKAREGFTIVELAFAEPSLGTVSVYNGKKSRLRAYLYKLEHSDKQLLKLVGEAKKNSQKELFFDCYFQEHTYFLFIQSEHLDSTLSYSGENRPTLAVKEEVIDNEMRNETVEYLPIRNIQGFETEQSMLQTKESVYQTAVRANRQASMEDLRKMFVDLILRERLR